MSDPIPFIRLGVLHFLGSFFNVDEYRILDPTYCLDVEKIEKGALGFVETITPKDIDLKQNGQAWEILYSALGIPLDVLRMKESESPQKYVARLWHKMLAMQGISVSIRSKKRGWGLSVNPSETAQTALRLAENRVKNSSSDKILETNIISQNDSKLQDSIGLVLEKAIQNKQRVLILTPTGDEARSIIPFLFQHSVRHNILGTSNLIANDKQLFTTLPSKMHKAPVLLLSANYVPLSYLPDNYHLVILWKFQQSLDMMHVTDPLPNFIELAKKDNHQFPQVITRIYGKQLIFFISFVLLFVMPILYGRPKQKADPLCFLSGYEVHRYNGLNLRYH